MLACALVLGGASRLQVLSSDIVALIALPLLGWAILRVWRGYRPEWRWPLALLAAAFAVPLLQLLPLPPGVWTSLPGRGPVVEGLVAAGLEPGWAPISLSPLLTQASLIAMLPAAAVFLAALTADDAGRWRLVYVMLGVGAVSVLLAILQLVGGAESPLRFYDVTNPSAAVGFFSNRNHLATLMICIAVLGAAPAARPASSRQVMRARWLISAAAIAMAAIGAGMTGSRAGLFLIVPAGLGALALVWPGLAARGVGRWAVAGLGAAVVVVAGLVAVTFGEAVARLQAGFADDDRLAVAGTSWQAVRAFAPFGSGLGTFVPAYQMFEQPASMSNTFVNHAHNDWIELAVVGGVPALIALAAFLYWFGRTALAAWRPGAGARVLPRVGTLCMLLILVHSGFDYPLRTAAMMCVFAVMAAFATGPARSRRHEATDPVA